MSANCTSVDDVKAYVSQMGNTVLNNRDISVMGWESVLDNHNPPRNYSAGYVVKYANDNVREGYVLFHDGQFGNQRALAFAIDNGKTTQLFYLASYNESGGFFIIHPFPIDMDMGPRKLYQIRVKPDQYADEFVSGRIREIQYVDKDLDDFPYHVRVKA